MYIQVTWFSASVTRIGDLIVRGDMIAHDSSCVAADRGNGLGLEAVHAIAAGLETSTSIRWLELRWCTRESHYTLIHCGCNVLPLLYIVKLILRVRYLSDIDQNHQT
jgi:hypothetical protein